MWFTGVEVEQETSAPPPKKNPGSAPEGESDILLSNLYFYICFNALYLISFHGTNIEAGLHYLEQLV